MGRPYDQGVPAIAGSADAVPYRPHGGVRVVQGGAYGEAVIDPWSAITNPYQPENADVCVAVRKDGAACTAKKVNGTDLCRGHLIQKVRAEQDV